MRVPLAAFSPTHEFFVGVDSDGCAFDAMEIKHVECFTPATIQVWGLQAISRAARETALFVNLYSSGRGLNRWRALDRLFELLRERPEPAAPWGARATGRRPQGLFGLGPAAVRDRRSAMD